MWLCRQDIYISYLRTAVSCDTSNVTDIGEALTANWSGSLYCYDRNYVIGEATRNQGWLTAMGYALKVCSVFFLGIVADTSGRRLVMIVGSAALIVAFGLLALNSYIDNGTTLILITVSSVIQGLTNPVTGGVSPFVTAMVADMTSESTRGLGMTSYAAVRTLFSIIAFGIGYYILSLDLTDYTLVWAGFAGVAVVTTLLFVFVAQETLGARDTDATAGTTGDDNETPTPSPADSSSPSSSVPSPLRRLNRGAASKVQRKPLAQAIRNNPCAGCCIVGRSKFLRLFTLSVILMYCAFGGTFMISTSYLLAQMDWIQANASLALFCQSCATIAGYIMNYWTVANVRGESYTTFGIGVSAAALGNLMVGLLSPYHVAAFWVGFLIIGIAYGFALPALPTIASLHAEPEEQAQLQSTFTVATMIGLIVASELHTNIYDENAVGIIAGTPFFASVGLLVVSLIIHVAVCYCLELARMNVPNNRTLLTDAFILFRAGVSLLSPEDVYWSASPNPVQISRHHQGNSCGAE